ncbi:hypothetical protein MBM_06121 [Drepanopeziza brunnea f. sp. 'multigermtubi' MB_m1]|uniref:Uncharacterized protein n=1 Tax=Marssonina brunnea f. sp. multigermtubi (strain MB_m1) TaxID=1072389 RepID=K1X470_MARBU|nr:uncharacterized protein MBM_06121 [Drepanopeziza brunnea f. sp. 'multigermtubi' MB_m1]EKD15493.1 hypothetical protein MBM_06121 [Drepanopeziza brunnea f. sp. 'multigermtubi' MB_m1]
MSDSHGSTQAVKSVAEGAHKPRYKHGRTRANSWFKASVTILFHNIIWAQKQLRGSIKYKQPAVFVAYNERRGRSNGPSAARQQGAIRATNLLAPTSTPIPKKKSQLRNSKRKQERITGKESDPAASPAVIPQLRRRPPTQEDYVSVRPESSYLHFKNSLTMASISGYIDTERGPVPITANLDPEFPQNLISVACVARLGLVIESHGTGDDGGTQEVMIDFGRGEKSKSSGQVVFRWSAGVSSHRIPFNVTCLVYEHNIRSLVLGQPFVEKRQHYWNGGEDGVGTENGRDRWR